MPSNKKKCLQNLLKHSLDSSDIETIETPWQIQKSLTEMYIFVQVQIWSDLALATPKLLFTSNTQKKLKNTNN